MQVVAELSGHYADRFQRKTAPTWRRRIVRNGQLKITALLTACVLWLLLAYQTETIQRTFLLPVEYRNLPNDLSVAEPRANRAEITLSGAEKNFEMLDARKLAVSLDLGKAPLETPFEVRLEEHLKNLPEDLEVRNVRPQVVKIYVRRADDGR